MQQIKRLQLGKNGLSENFMSQVTRIFEHETMIKIALLKSVCRDKSEAVAIGEALIARLGKKFNYKLVGYVITLTKFRKDQR